MGLLNLRPNVSRCRSGGNGTQSIGWSKLSPNARSWRDDSHRKFATGWLKPWAKARSWSDDVSHQAHSSLRQWVALYTRVSPRW